MGSINLRSFSVLVVDLDDAHRWMLNNALEGLGVGEVMTANSNEDALNMLKRLGKRDMAERVDSVDIVVCDLEGQPVDGTSLVRWIRMHPDSPNRFLPVILMAKTFGQEELRQARGYGATHFLAKPVTAKTLMDRLLTVINRPRPFVYTGEYFGPDRRGARPSRRVADDDRRNADRDEGTDRRGKEDRRNETEKKKHLVKSTLTEALERFPSDNLLRIFRPPNHLKRKAGAMDDGDGLFTEGAAFKAEKAIEKAQDDYGDSALDMVESLQRILSEAAGAKDRSGHFTRINTLAAQLGLQGETFNYPLVTTVGNSLARLTAGTMPEGKASLDIVTVHVDTMTAVLKNKVTGDGGEIGQQLVSELQAAIKRITKTTKA